MPPLKSQRQKLRDKGYSQLTTVKNGTSVFSETRAHELAEKIHKKGHLAQAVRIRDPDGGEWWVVMYKRK